ncbi:MAG TPA: ferritin-like domain-containing protein [Gammaproteobacteria bacterium]|nr:ferritin-like domain-containing protein [Gammaproteobacteria bacterium]
MNEPAIRPEQPSDSLFAGALSCLQLCDLQEKLQRTREVAAQWRAGRLSLQASDPPADIDSPGRPPRPRLVAPKALARRRLSSLEGRGALLHAIAHIEFNAINLAWDAVYRFRGMPERYYDDWVQVATEEAYHFSLLQARLQALGFDYGDFDAHDGLWQMARRTAHDVLVRMALVPRVLEARGLDVTPGMMERLRAAGDDASAEILAVILRDEVGHVAIGSRWFRHQCELRGLDSETLFPQLLEHYMKGRVKGPFHCEARLKAGFTPAELAHLERQQEDTLE